MIKHTTMILAFIKSFVCVSPEASISHALYSLKRSAAPWTRKSCITKHFQLPLGG